MNDIDNMLRGMQAYREQLLHGADAILIFLAPLALSIVIIMFGFMCARPLWTQVLVPWQSRVRPKLESNGAPTKTLLVAAHGLGGVGEMRDAIALARQSLGGCDTLLVRWGSSIFPAGNPVSNADPLLLAANMDKAVGKVVEEGGYEKIVLLGYSTGALLARKALVFNHPNFGADHPDLKKENAASAKDKKAQIAPAAHKSARTATLTHGRSFAPQWWNKVERLVLIAGINGGWSREHFRFLYVFPAAFFISFCQMIGVGALVRALERGHPFVENLRIDWLRMSDELDEQAKDKFTAVQLIGVRDGIVDAESEMDLAATARFFYISLPKATHKEIVRFGRPLPEKPLAVRADKEKSHNAHALALAIEAQPATLDGRQTLEARSPSLYDPDLLKRVVDETGRVSQQERVEQVERVVIVLHGIRDDGHWGNKFRLVIESATGAQGIAVTSPTFGRFPLTDFMLGRRDQPVRWFARMYSELLATYPSLKNVSVIAHSYGTWVVAKALERYASLTLDTVFLAGSVLPHGYDWNPFVNAGRVRAVTNAPADSDWIVGIFPGSYQAIRVMLTPLLFLSRPAKEFFSVGDAGVTGFRCSCVIDNQLPYLKGGHGAFKEQPAYLRIAGRFAVEGPSVKYKEEVDELRRVSRHRPTPVTAFLNRTSIFWLLFVLAALAAALAVMIFPFWYVAYMAQYAAWTPIILVAGAAIVMTTLLYRFLRYF